ncbi:EEF1A lysine methyltransferase 1 isoform X2 [Loxodonta africana]|uniref:EEF1A lysine methyltransferase 1 isoform X2 n=1 Tax=Loxodonta africana TaxID=9785 RepID=UPI000C810CB0|nr:EEF1A lysine methyltransferase 1 isoform X2 [Loxodonta africana]
MEKCAGTPSKSVCEKQIHASVGTPTGNRPSPAFQTNMGQGVCARAGLTCPAHVLCPFGKLRRRGGYRQFCEMSNSNDDDIPQLSSHTLAALQEFYAEQQQRTDSGGNDKYSIGIIEENWQLSQFWYSQETALRLAEEVIAVAGEGGRIACVSTPSVYQKLRELHREDFSVCIFEYDKRFAIYGEEFIFYDYNNPLDLPEKIAAHSFDVVIADPPYLSEECLRKTSETIKYLTQGKILLCTVLSTQLF